MSQLFRYPPTGGGSSANASVGPNGSPITTSSTLVAGENPSGDQQPLQTDASGNLLVTGSISASNPSVDVVGNIAPLQATQIAGFDSDGNLAVPNVEGNSMSVFAQSLPLPTGAATAALQTSGNASLVTIGTNTGTSATNSATIVTNTGNTATNTSNINTKIPSGLTVTSTRLLTDGSGVTQPVSVASLPLPTGAATETTLSALNTKVPANLTVTSTRLLVDGSGVTQPVSAASLPLPTGAATETTLAAINTKTPSLGQAAMTASVPVVIASNQTVISTAQTGLARSNAPKYNDYTTTSVTTGAYVQMIASTTAAATQVEIFDSSGQALLFAVGGSGSEVDQFLIYPGGNGIVPLAIPSGSRISLKAQTATANVGYIIINLYG